MSFVSAQINTDPSTFVQDGITQINTTLAANGYPGWTANDAALAVIILWTVAQIAADVAQVASTVVPAIFRAFGTQLLGLAYQVGTYATVQTTWTFTQPAPVGGYTIDAGTTLVIGGQAFYVGDDFTTNTGDTSAVITVQANAAGSAYNGLGGVDAPANLISGIDWIESVTTQGLTTGGQDQETDPEYQDRLAGVLQLQAPRPVKAPDFAAMVLSDYALQNTGVAVGRATAIDNYYPDGRVLSTGGTTLPSTMSCSVLRSSAQVTLTSPPGNQVPAPGASVSGALAAPVLATPTAAGSGGSFSAGTYYYQVTATNALGQTVGSNEESVAVTGSEEVTLTWGAVTGATGYKVYRATAAGGETTSPALVGTISSGSTVTYTDSGTAAATGAVPATDSTSPIPTGTTVLEVNTEAEVTLSANATGTGTFNLTFSQLAGYGPVHLTATGNLANENSQATELEPYYYLSVADVGARVTGPGVPGGAVVVAEPPADFSQFTMSTAAISAETGATLTVSSWTNVERCVTTFVTDVNGNPLTAADMDALQTWLEGYREQNFLVFVNAPTYSTVYVDVEIHVLPNYQASAVAAQVQAALVGYLNPATWGIPPAYTGGSDAWLNSEQGFNYVRVNKLIGVAESVLGVDYVFPGALSVGFTADPTGTTDIILPGPAPLPQSSASTVTVTTA